MHIFCTIPFSDLWGLMSGQGSILVSYRK